MNVSEFTQICKDFSKQSTQVSFRALSPAPEVLEIQFTGLIDTYNTEESRKILVLAFDIQEIKHIVFNLSQLNYMSSTGVGSFASLLKTCRTTNKELYLMSFQPKLKEVFDLLGFNQFFNHIEHISDIGKKKDLVSIFPKKFKCPNCTVTLKVNRPGKFACSACKSTVIVDDLGNVK